ncbi:hypothetical protein KAU11_02590, partial [Candidatus Babeliales bacterium]|nr:hypothetical protein [Candidatus Babeliales bacterium]
MKIKLIFALLFLAIFSDFRLTAPPGDQAVVKPVGLKSIVKGLEVAKPPVPKVVEAVILGKVQPKLSEYEKTRNKLLLDAEKAVVAGEFGTAKDLMKKLQEDDDDELGKIRKDLGENYKSQISIKGEEKERTKRVGDISFLKKEIGWRNRDLLRERKTFAERESDVKLNKLHKTLKRLEKAQQEANVKIHAEKVLRRQSELGGVNTGGRSVLGFAISSEKQLRKELDKPKWRKKIESIGATIGYGVRKIFESKGGYAPFGGGYMPGGDVRKKVVG